MILDYNEDYYNQIKFRVAFNDNYLELKRNIDGYKNLPLAGKLNENLPYFKELLNTFIDSNDS